MTSKEKYEQTLDNLVKFLTPIHCIDTKRQKPIEEMLSTFRELLDEYNELTHHPSLSECIKEWEERGWKASYICEGIELSKLNDDIVEYFYFDKDLKRIDCNCFISFDLIPLIHKTLKALENSNETK